MQSNRKIELIRRTLKYISFLYLSDFAASTCRYSVVFLQEQKTHQIIQEQSALCSLRPRHCIQARNTSGCVNHQLQSCEDVTKGRCVSIITGWSLHCATLPTVHSPPFIYIGVGKQV